MATTRRSASKDAASWLPDEQSDWLPPATPKPLMSNLRVRPFISAQKHHHWWLALADAIYETQDDRPQGKMVAKMYAFLHDFLPDGLTGPWSHIQGKDVMNILLCQTKEMSVSRHKATQNAQAALEHLEAWMKKGKNWREAASHGMADVIKRRGPRKPPVLYKPAAVLALLIIAYPDPKYRLWIGRLQIGWMMGRHDQLDIRSGFWEGLTPADLQMFQVDEARDAEVPLLADYTKMFGDDFVSTTKDIRPFLPRWAEGPNALVHVDGEALDADDPVGDLAVDDCSDVGSSIIAERCGSTGESAGLDDDDAWTAGLNQHLNPDQTLPPELELQSWILDRLKAGNETDILHLWCGHWSRRMDAARWFEEQAIVRSLFTGSLRILYSLSKSTVYASMADVYLLLDMEDGKARSVPSDPDTVNSIARLEKLPLYKPFVTAKESLERTALDDSRRDHLKTAFCEQFAFFYELIRDGALNKHVKDVVRLDTARIALLQKHAPKDIPTAGPVDNATITTLKLTKWQLRVLAVSPLDSVLSDWQQRLRALDAFAFPAVRAEEVTNMHDVDSDLRETLVHLFGDIQTPFAAVHGDVFSKTHDNDRDSHKCGSSSHRATESHSSDALEHSTKSNTDNSRHRSASRLTTPGPVSPLTPRVGVFPGGNLPSAQDETPVLSTPSWNPFAGRVSAKRACSPDRYPVKAPRRTLSIGDIRTDLITSSERLRDQIVEVTEEKSTWLSKRLNLAAEQTEAKILMVQRAIESATRQADVKLESLIATVAEVQDLGRETDVRVKSFIDSSETKSQQTHMRLNSLADSLEADDTRHRQMEEGIKSLTDAFEASDVRQRQADERIKSLTDTVETLRQSMSKQTTLQPGQEGFLALNCQAPPGWDQKAYDAVLLRAGWYYVASMGMPDDGVDADHDAFTMMAQKFPKVDGQHLLKALEHAHSMAYNRPFDTQVPSQE